VRVVIAGRLFQATSCLDPILIHNANSTVLPEPTRGHHDFLGIERLMSDPIKLEAVKDIISGPNLDCYVPAFNIVELTELSPE
jgi:hypothetical protein